MQNTGNDNSVTRMKLQKDWVSSGKGNRKQYYEQEGTKFIPNQKNITMQSYFCIIHGIMRMTSYIPFTTYQESYISKQDIIHENAKRFNEDCVAFDLDLQDLENKIPQSAWEMVAPNIVQDDRTTHVQGFSTLQNEQQEKEDTIDTVCDDNTRNKRDKLSMLYAKAAKRQDMNFSGLLQTCMHLEQRSMPYSNVQQNMVQELHKCTKTWKKARRIQNFSEWPRGGQGKVMLYI